MLRRHPAKYEQFSVDMWLIKVFSFNQLFRNKLGQKKRTNLNERLTSQFWMMIRKLRKRYELSQFDHLVSCHFKVWLCGLRRPATHTLLSIWQPSCGCAVWGESQSIRRSWSPWTRLFSEGTRLSSGTVCIRTLSHTPRPSLFALTDRRPRRFATEPPPGWHWLH